MSKVLFVLLASLCVAYAGLLMERLGPKPEKFRDQQGCYIKELDEMIPFGTSVPSKNRCQEYQCQPNGILHVSCGVAHAHYPCKLVEEKNKPYPDCCPQITCG